MKNQRFWGCKVSSERSQSDSPSGRSNVRNDPKVTCDDEKRRFARSNTLIHSQQHIVSYCECTC